MKMMFTLTSLQKMLFTLTSLQWMKEETNAIIIFRDPEFSFSQLLRFFDKSLQ